MPKLCAAVAYYPTTVPANVTFPPSLQVAIHLAGSQNFGTKANYSYTYPDTEIGFAEHRTGDDRDVYNKVSTRLAWSRTLGCLRKGFNIEHSVEMEELWERHLLQAFSRKDADRTMATMYDDGDSNDDDQLHVNHVPTMVGGEFSLSLSLSLVYIAIIKILNFILYIYRNRIPRSPRILLP